MKDGLTTLPAVDVGPVVDAYDVNEACLVVDPVDEAIGAATCRVVSPQFADEWLAEPLRVLQQRSGEEPGDRRRHRQWKPLWWWFD